MQARTYNRLSLVVLAVFLFVTIAQMPMPVQAAGEPQYGGSLKIVRTHPSRGFGYPPRMRTADIYFAFPCLDALVTYDKNGKLIPKLATSWKLSEDKKSITLKLRKGVKFHDGTDFNAKAVKWNMQAVKKEGKMPDLNVVASIDVIDDHTVRLNLSEYTNLLMYNLAQYAGLQISPTAVKKNGKKWAITHPVGTGPFKFVSFKRDVGIKFERFDGYWGGKPYLDKVEYVIISDPMTASALMKTGDAHMWISPIDPKDIEELKKHGLKARLLEGGGSRMLMPDSKNPDSPFANKTVREAIEYALDREAIAKVIGKGIYTPWWQFAPSISMGYNPDYKGRAYNPEKAKQLLSKAGYPKGFKTKLFIRSGSELRQFAALLQSYLSAVGIVVDVDFIDRGKYASLSSKGWKNGLLYVGGQYRVNYVESIDVLLSPKTAWCYSVNRPTEFSQLLEKAKKAEDAKTHQALTKQLVKLMADETMFFPLWGKPSPVIMQKNVHSDWYEVPAVWNAQKTWIGK